MPNLQRRSLIAGASFVGAAAVARAALAGDLNPPAGAIAPSGRSLKDVEPRTPMSSVAGTPECVHFISQPGSYYLTGDIDVPDGQSGIVVAAAGPVAIDMRGFTIHGSPGSFKGIHCQSPACTYLEISDGFLSDLGAEGIDGGGAAVLEVHDVHLRAIAGHAIVGHTNLCVTECRAEGGGSHGLVWSPKSNISLYGGARECIIDDCESSNNAGSGFHCACDGSVPDVALLVCESEFIGNGLDGAAASFSSAGGTPGGDGRASVTLDALECTSNGRFGIGVQAPAGPLGTAASVVLECEDCTCAHNVSHGMMLSTAEVAVCDCDCLFNGGHGMSCDAVSGAIECCTCSKNSQCGLSATNVQCSIDEIECRSNASHGLQGNVVIGSIECCECSSNGGDGMQLTALTGNVECCLCCSNTGSGVTATNVQGAIDELDCRSNGANGMVCSEFAGSIDECDCSSNTNAGILIMSGSSACVCCCSCRSNGDEGIYAAAGSGGVSISECETQSNGAGFRVESTGALLLWNTSHGDGVPFDVNPANPTVILASASLPISNSPHANYIF